VKLCAATLALVALASAGCGSSKHEAARKAIVYAKFLSGGGEEVWIASPDGSGKRRLGYGGSPQISPDGRWVAFQGSCDRGYCDKLLVVPSSGGKPRSVADNVLRSTWSPDGRRLLTYRPVNEEVGRLLVVDREGGATVQVAQGNLIGWSFSPSGDAIAFGRDLKGKDDVFVVPAHGGASRRITHDGRSTSPVWTSKGILISHAINGPIPHHGWGANEVWLIDSDGGNPRSLSGRLPARILGSGVTGLTPVAWSDGSLLAGLINEFGWPPYAVDTRTKTVRPIANLGFGAVADGLSRNGRNVLVEVGSTEGTGRRRVVLLPFAGGRARLIARSAGDASWNL
jgi:WD40-like Beta Propeller Repeat